MSGAAHEHHDETIRPSQYFTANRAVMPAQGERRLMVALLEDAIACFEAGLRSDGEQTRALAEEAREWFADTDTEYLYSFVNVCEFLDIDPQAVHSHLRRIEARHPPRPPVMRSPTPMLEPSGAAMTASESSDLFEASCC